MKRRDFFRVILLGGICIAGAVFFSGCIAPRISDTAWVKTAGSPYRCEKCGHLTRSETDITAERCPRCRARMMRKITEKQMANYLAND